MLTIKNLTKSHAGRTLFRETEMTINWGERVALVGPNGAGKSTLFRMILGEDTPDEGSISMDEYAIVGYLPQEASEPKDETVLEIALGITPEMEQAIHTIRTAENANKTDTPEYAEAIDTFNAANGYQLEPKAKKILKGLAFRESDFHRPAREMSGGWIMRAYLAKLLVLEPDLLMLDEPTNHLDLLSLLWLQRYLKNYPGAILMISHDRDFMDELVESVYDIDNEELVEYRGNYSDFLQQKDVRFEQLQAAYRNQQKEIAHIQEFIDRFRSINSKAGQVQSRIKQLEKVELIEVEEDDAVMNFHFPAPPAGAHSVVRLEKVSKHYGSVSVFENVDFEIVKGDRIAIVGVNGAGKSTFSRLISGGEAPSSGSVTMGRHTQVAFFSQTHADDLDPEKTILECVEAAATRESAPMVRNLLGCFLFRGDDVHKRVGVLSGGERSRVALVCMLLHPANFLILDEPTNHLDIQSQQVLQQALSEYPGSYCIVSHNRSFLDPIVTKVLEFVPGEKPRVYLGNVSDYLEKVERNQALAAAAALPPSGAAEPGAGLDRKARRRMEAEIRQKKTRLLRPLQEKLELLEEEIARLETEKTEITSQLERPDVAADTEAVMELTSRFQQTDRQLETCFTQWADLSEKIEETEARIQEEAERNVSGS